MTDYEMLAKIDALVTDKMCMYEKASRKAYKAQSPSYLMGMFEAVYQFAYAVIESENIQDAVDFLNDDIRYYARFDNRYMHGYIKAASYIVDEMEWLEDDFKYEYGIKRAWSLYNFKDIERALND